MRFTSALVALSVIAAPAAPALARPTITKTEFCHSHESLARTAAKLMDKNYAFVKKSERRMHQLAGDKPTENTLRVVVDASNSLTRLFSDQTDVIYFLMRNADAYCIR